MSRTRLWVALTPDFLFSPASRLLSKQKTPVRRQLFLSVRHASSDRDPPQTASPSRLFRHSAVFYHRGYLGLGRSPNGLRRAVRLPL